MTTTTTKSIYTVWDAIHEIAIMLEDEGYTSAEVRAAADTLRRIKAELWEAERFTDKDSTKLLGNNIWALDHAADEMDRIFGTGLMSDEAEDDLASDIEWAIEEMWTNIKRINEEHEAFDSEDYFEGTSHEEFCEEEPRRICDEDLGQLLGDFEWQYDVDEIIDMMSEMDWSTCTRYWKRDADMPTMEEIEGCQWTPITENVEHLLEWYGQQDEPDIVDVDEEKVIEELSEEDEEGHRVWKPVTGFEVRSALYDNALVTSDNMGCYSADEMGEHLHEMWDVLEWLGCENLMLSVDDEDEEHILDSILVALTDEHQNWHYLTRSEAIKVVEEVIRG